MELNSGILCRVKGQFCWCNQVVLVDSGLRLVEAVYVINNVMEAESVNGFYRCDVALFRGCKQAYYAHFQSTL